MYKNQVFTIYSIILIIPLTILNLMLKCESQVVQYKHVPSKFPNCPEIPTRRETLKMLYDNETRACYVEHSQGPCGSRMIFYQDLGYRDAEKYGFCDCDDILKDFSVWGRLAPPPRPLIFIPKFNRCFPAFSQGPCGSGEWLVLNKNLKPECQKNICASEEGYVDDDESWNFWFAHKHFCYETFTQGFCRENKRLQPTEHSWEPKCEYFYDDEQRADCHLTTKQNINERILCRPGRRKRSIGKCRN